MFEISIATIGAVILKLLWLSLTAIVSALFFLWPIGDQPTSTEQKTCFVVVVLLVALFIFDVITFTA